MQGMHRKTSRIPTILGILLIALSSPVLLQAQDLIPPSAPSDLIAEATNCSHVGLSWTASTDEVGGSGLYAYIIQRWEGGNLWNQVTIRAGRTTFSDTNHVTPSTALTYTVVAVDRAGNKSAASNAVTVIARPCPGTPNEQIAGDFEGELEVSVEDYAVGKSRTLYFLQTPMERLSLQFTNNPPRLLTGAHVHLKGVLADRALVVTSGDASVETLALDSTSTSSASSTTTATSSVLPNTFGAQRTLVVLVNFQDNPAQPYTPAFVQNLVFTDVSNFYRENSYQQTWLSGDVYGWYTIPVASTT